MRRECGTFCGHVRAYVDAVGDQPTPSPCFVELCGIEALRCQVQPVCQVSGLGDRFARQGGLEQGRTPVGSSPGVAHGRVQMPMIRVSVTSERVVAHEDVCLLLVHDSRDAVCDFGYRDVREPGLDRGIQPGVRVPQQHRPRHTESPRGQGEFACPGGCEVCDVRSGQPRGPICGHDEHYAMTGGTRLGHGARGEQRLVIGMRMAENRGGHEDILVQVSYGRWVRIVHISDCFAPRAGGIETQVQALAERQSAAGHAVTVVTATPGHGDHRSGDDVVAGVPVVRLSARMPFDLPVHPSTRTHVLRVLRERRADVVHVHAGAASPFAWGGIRAARQARIPTVVTVHSMWDPITRGGNRALDRTSWGMGSGVVLTAVGTAAADRVSEALRRPVLVLPNGIDPQDWSVTRVAGGQDLRVVTVSRLAPRKRVLPLVSVLRRAIAASQGGIRATIIGNGPDSGRVERYLDRHALRDVITVTGRLSHTRIRAHFATADVFVQASVRESFGIAALEARAAGLAIVARRQSGISDFVDDGVEGLLCDDDAGLVDALLTLRSDRGLLEQMVAHNSTVPPAQAWPHVLDQVDRAYDIAKGMSGRALG